MQHSSIQHHPALKLVDCKRTLCRTCYWLASLKLKLASEKLYIDAWKTTFLVGKAQPDRVLAVWVNFIATSTNLNPKKGIDTEKQTPHEIVQNIPTYTVSPTNTSQILPKYPQNTSPNIPKEGENISSSRLAGALLNSMWCLVDSRQGGRGKDTPRWFTTL